MYLASALGADMPPLSPEILESAQRWANIRGLPVQWILSTILVESNGNPRTVGDRFIIPEGASVGLMQVNTVAWKNALKKAGVTRAMLFNVDKNIEWGSKILRQKYDMVAQALARTRRPLRNPVPIDALTRLLYTGQDVLKAIYNGTDPRAHPRAPHSILAWNNALNTTSAYSV